MAKKETLHSLVTFILFAALCAMGYLWYSGQLGPRANVIGDKLKGDSGLLKTEGQFREKLAELRMDKDKVLRNVKRLERLKAQNVKYLRDKGINSGADFLNSKDPDITNAAINLKEWKSQIDKINTEVSFYDEAISNIKTMLDRFERERINEEATLSDEEYMELQKVILDLNERLNNDTTVIEEEKLRELLDSEMLDSDSESDSDD